MKTAYRILYDQSKCTGCRMCEAICSFTREDEFNPVKARCKIIRSIKKGMLTKVRVSCQQCSEPKCLEVCPRGAISQTETGVKFVDEKLCIGCRMCEMACPVGAISVNQEKGVSFKCDLCKDYDEPNCVKYCYTGAIRYMPEEKIAIALSRMKSEKYLENTKEV